MTTNPTPKKPRGFAAMSPERHRAISSKGGSSVRPEKRSFYTNPDLAIEAGRKGGKAFSRDPALARGAGAKGGRAKAMEAAE
jgi:general stress protein YciG